VLFNSPIPFDFLPSGWITGAGPLRLPSLVNLPLLGFDPGIQVRPPCGTPTSTGRGPLPGDRVTSHPQGQSGSTVSREAKTYVQNFLPNRLNRGSDPGRSLNTVGPLGHVLALGEQPRQ